MDMENQLVVEEHGFSRGHTIHFHVVAVHNMVDIWEIVGGVLCPVGAGLAQCKHWHEQRMPCTILYHALSV